MSKVKLIYFFYATQDLKQSCFTSEMELQIIMQSNMILQYLILLVVLKWIGWIR